MIREVGKRKISGSESIESTSCDVDSSWAGRTHESLEQYGPRLFLRVLPSIIEREKDPQARKSEPEVLEVLARRCGAE